MKDIKKVKSKEEARQIAIDWQDDFSNKSTSYSELFKDQSYFRKLGKKFKLTEEFEENGII